jgi:hypothetical protein
LADHNNVNVLIVDHAVPSNPLRIAPNRIRHVIDKGANLQTMVLCYSNWQPHLPGNFGPKHAWIVAKNHAPQTEVPIYEGDGFLKVNDEEWDEYLERSDLRRTWIEHVWDYVPCVNFESEYSYEVLETVHLDDSRDVRPAAYMRNVIEHNEITLTNRVILRKTLVIRDLVKTLCRSWFICGLAMSFIGFAGPLIMGLLFTSILVWHLYLIFVFVLGSAAWIYDKLEELAIVKTLCLVGGLLSQLPMMVIYSLVAVVMAVLLAYYNRGMTISTRIRGGLEPIMTQSIGITMAVSETATSWTLSRPSRQILVNRLNNQYSNMLTVNRQANLGSAAHETLNMFVLFSGTHYRNQFLQPLPGLTRWAVRPHIRMPATVAHVPLVVPIPAVLAPVPVHDLIAGKIYKSGPMNPNYSDDYPRSQGGVDFYAPNPPLIKIDKLDYVINGLRSRMGESRIRKLDFGCKASVKWRIKTANYPIGTLWSGSPSCPTRVGCGLMPATCTLTSVAAFARAFKKPTQIQSSIQDFEVWAMANIPRHIDQIQQIVPPENKDRADAYRKVCKSKLSQAQIEQDIEQCEEFLLGRKIDLKLLRASAFVKLENSAKMNGFLNIRDLSPEFQNHVKQVITVKPRLIMVMPLLMKYLTCQINALFDAWQHDFTTDSSVKRMNMPTVACLMTRLYQHERVSSTDYSNYEASFRDRLKVIIKHFVRLLCERYGYSDTVVPVTSWMYANERELHTNGFIGVLLSRNSGDWDTAAMNNYLNKLVLWYVADKLGILKRLCVRLFSSKAGDFMYLHVMHGVSFTTEGDDCLHNIGYNYASAMETLIEELGFVFSSATKSWGPQASFLSKRYVDDKIYLNVGKSMGFLAVKTNVVLKHSKNMAILRCMGMSLNDLSPGHPVLASLVNRIERQTRGYSKFKGIDRYLNPYAGITARGYDSYPRDISVDETMRREVELGGTEMPGIPLRIQYQLEHMFDNDSEMYVGNALDMFEEFRIMCDSWLCFDANHLHEHGFHPTLKTYLNTINAVCKIQNFQQIDSLMSEVRPVWCD